MTETLWIDDDELIARSGVSPERMRQLILEFDRNPLSGFPKKQRLYENKRYWPAVQEYWATINKLPANRGARASVEHPRKVGGVR